LLAPRNSITFFARHPPGLLEEFPEGPCAESLMEKRLQQAAQTNLDQSRRFMVFLLRSFSGPSVGPACRFQAGRVHLELAVLLLGRGDGCLCQAAATHTEERAKRAAHSEIAFGAKEKSEGQDR
jgi:hypothetical protein